MKIRFVGSAVGSGAAFQFVSSFIINDTVAIDAGSIGFMTPLADQQRIQHVFLSHSHIDHLASLPIFIDNVYRPGPECVTVHAQAATLDALRTDILNDRLWPDLVRLSAAESPFLRMQALTSEQSVNVEGLTITPVELKHVVPTVGFLIADEQCVVAIVSDTSPSERIWEIANATPRLTAMFLEVSFPNSMTWLAEKAMHLTPHLFGKELQKLQREIDVIAVHIKPNFRTQVVEELAALGLPRLRIGEPEMVYEF